MVVGLDGASDGFAGYFFAIDTEGHFLAVVFSYKKVEFLLPIFREGRS